MTVGARLEHLALDRRKATHVVGQPVRLGPVAHRMLGCERDQRRARALLGALHARPVPVGVGRQPAHDCRQELADARWVEIGERDRPQHRFLHAIFRVVRVGAAAPGDRKKSGAVGLNQVPTIVAPVQPSYCHEPHGAWLTGPCQAMKKDRRMAGPRT